MIDERCSDTDVTTELKRTSSLFATNSFDHKHVLKWGPGAVVQSFFPVNAHCYAEKQDRCTRNISMVTVSADQVETIQPAF